MTPYDFTVWVHLCEHRNNQTGLCCPSTRHLAEEIGINRSTVIQSLKRGEEIGLYVVHPTDHGVKKVNRYEWGDELVSDAHVVHPTNHVVRPTVRNSSRDKQLKVKKSSGTPDVPRQVRTFAAIKKEMGL